MYICQFVAVYIKLLVYRRAKKKTVENENCEVGYILEIVNFVKANECKRERKLTFFFVRRLFKREDSLFGS